jgi:flagellar motor switch protein FliM
MDQAEILFNRVRRVNLPIIAHLGSAQLTVRELLDLERGDVIQLDQRTDEDLYVCVGKEYRYRAVPGTHRKKRAVKLTRILASMDDL